ncbi:SusC/RagA family TonB-linked outer membrane protein [Desertivirga arenae]|uniref:SusC/RagA family TonB-linked outer membrane protein n=1 Tax=Desertivirga arenae TaxID=2810309 RepID=UPI001A966A90|nr:SusC/RagA family TonB-linked outer membrane protein [Pedobacter sp. SYSU D00823]
MKTLKQKLFFQAVIGAILIQLALAMPVIAQGQTFNVRGVIRDSQGETLVGVSIKLKGGSAATTSDASGRYSINIPNPNGTLVFSYISFATREVQVSGRSQVDVTLESQNTSLEEVVVVAYGTQKKATVSGAISTIQSEDIVRTPAVAATSALVGKVPGVTARTTDSRPGNGANLQIRNLGNPLYVIDGVAYSTSNGTDVFGYNTGISGVNAFNQLGLDDIESITVLKDASASIYGLAGGNGVVLVTTKKGKKGQKPSLGVSSYYGLQNFTRYPRPGNAPQYVRGRLESEQNQGRDPSALFTREEFAKWEAGTEPGYQSTDYYDFVTRPNVPQYFLSANASGGTDKSNYYVSASHVNQDAIIKDFSFKRSNIQANVSTKVLEGLTVSAQLSGRMEDRHNVGVPGLDDFFNPFLSIGSMWPTETPYANNNPRYINQTHNVNVNPATYSDDITGYIDNKTQAASGKLSAEYAFKFGLTAKALYAYDFSNDQFEGFEYTYPAYIYDPVTGQYNDRSPNGALYGNQNPWRERHKRNVESKFSQFQLSYNKQIKDHSFTGLLAFERREAINDYIALHSVPPNNIIKTQLVTDVDYYGDSHYEEAFEGYVGRINYDYKKKYLLEALARYDGSFLYRSGSRFGFFPGISLGWRISNEDFFKKIFSDKVNDFKLRASWGETGTSQQDVNGNYFDPGPFAYLGGYDVNSGNAVFDGTLYAGVDPRTIPTTTVSWMKNQMSNIGIDFTVYKHFTGQFDFFQRKRVDVPFEDRTVVIPGETGYVLPVKNQNSDKVRGFDGFITYSNKIRNVNFSVGVNGTLGRTLVQTRANERFGNSWDQYRNQVSDRWQNVNWGYQVQGRFQSQQEIDDYPVNIDGQGNRTLLPGDFIFKDVNGDGTINGLDERPIGYAEGAQPYFNYGLTGSVDYKGISLYFNFVGAGMQSFYRDWELRYPFQNDGNSPAYMLTDRWHRVDPYDPSSQWVAGTYPALRKNYSNHSNFRRSDYWLTNVRYFRLKNLELGYSIPKKVLGKVGINALRVYANGTNLFSFDNVKDFEIDPEISATNGIAYPQQRIYTFGFNLTL